MLKTTDQNNDNNPFVIQSGRYMSARPEGRYAKEWEESPSLAGKSKLGRGFELAKAWKLKIFFAALILVLLGRVFWLQVVKGAYYQNLSDGNRVRIERLEAKRGIIYDRNMRPLVRNTANWLLYFTPADLPSNAADRQALLDKISGILTTPSSQEMADSLSSIKPFSFEAYQPLFVTDQIDYQQAMLLYLVSAELPGVTLVSQNRRAYDLPSLSTSHWLGYTGKVSSQDLEKLGDDYSSIDYVGKTGLEYFWESDLRGQNGRKQIEVDALGKEKRIISQSEPEDGHNLVLSIDGQAQAKLEEIMQSHLAKLGLHRAVGIVLNPNNGEIIALVNLPAFNNNLFANGISQTDYQALAEHPDQPLFFRAISGEYPSGSTIKPIVLSAALQEGIVNEYTSFLSVGGIRIGAWFFPDWKAGGHGVTDAKKAIAESVNTYFYYLGGGFEDFVGLGIDKMVQYFKMFGLGAQTGIDLAGEATGFLPSKDWKLETKHERWYVGDTYHIAIGQGDLLVTPLQVAYYTTFFANGGTLYRPHLVKQILTANDKLITETETAPVKENTIDPAYVQVVRAGMRQAVLDGSARRLQSLPVSSAGKTGTAQWSTQYSPHAWFTGFAPYEEPQIAITILIEEGQGGDVTAVPVAEQFLYWYFTRQ